MDIKFVIIPNINGTAYFLKSNGGVYSAMSPQVLPVEMATGSAIAMPQCWPQPSITSFIRAGVTKARQYYS